MKNHISRAVLVLVSLLYVIVFPLTGQAQAHVGIGHGGCPAGQVFTAGDLSISGAFTRATLPRAKVGGAYLSIENAGQSPDRLIGAKAEIADIVELHQMHMEGDVMRMDEVEGGIEIAPGETVTLAPGGLHVMLIGLKSPLKVNECLTITLLFERAGEVPVELSVGGVSDDAAPEAHEGH